jgi:hypothetical protein
MWVMLDSPAKVPMAITHKIRANCHLLIAKPARGDIVLLAVKQPAAILGSAVFMVIAPGSIAVLVPYWICRC